MNKPIRVSLIVLTIFLAISAIGGGIQLLSGFYVPPVEMLNGYFKDYTIPGLSLGLIVGGSALSAAVLLIRKSEFASLASASTGVIIMFFEFVEVLIIGSPEGASRFMQILFFGLGTMIMILSIGSWFLELRAAAREHVLP
jgi:hypothetical protein